MQVVVVLFAVMAVAAASPVGLLAPTTLIRTPAHDSAVIRSDRLGGNFAYSTVEAQAYAAVSPVVQNVITPVGVSYHATPVVAHAPVVAPAVVPALGHAPLVAHW